MADFDFSELDKLAADLGSVARSAHPNVKKAVQVTANNVKKTWRSKLQGSSTLPGLPAALSYDVNTSIAGVDAEIGFDKGKFQGPLGNVSEYGTPTVAPRGFGLASLNENEDDFVKGIRMAADDSLDEAGL